MRQRQTVQAQWIDLDFLILFLTHSANRVVFCTLYQRGYTEGGSAPYNHRCRWQWLAGIKELNSSIVWLSVIWDEKLFHNELFWKAKELTP